MAYQAPNPSLPPPTFYPVPPGCDINLTVGGTRAFNDPGDVTVIQHLLNGVDLSAGGPHFPLAEDGFCGPRTVQAIVRFSTAQNSPTDTLFPNSLLHNQLCFYSANAGLMSNPYGP
jgi:hypothetical protein